MSKSWWKVLLPVTTAAAPLIVDYFSDKKAAPPKDTRSPHEREVKQLRAENSALHEENRRLLGELGDAKAQKTTAYTVAAGLMVGLVAIGVLWATRR